MDSEQHDNIVALGKTPISESSPAGDPVRYDEVFEQLQAQMDRIGSLSGEQVEWSTVVELGTEILGTKSKDLLVMTYTVLGLFEHEGYAGLHAGLEAYREFLVTFWERCYPKVKPPHGRFNAIQYLADKVLPLIELKAGKCAKQPGAGDKEAVHKCAETIGEVDAQVQKSFATQPESPNLLRLLRAFKALKQKVGPLGVEAPPPAAAGAPGAAPPAGGAAAAGASAVAAGVPDTFASAAQAMQSVVKIAKFLLSQDDKDARAYRLMRAAHFGGLSAAPKDKLIPAPPAPRRQFFENTAAGGDWKALLSQAEGQFATTPLWLDMQRYAAMALKGLGPAYAAAHDAVVLEAVALQRRLPAVFDLTFKDGSSFADGATKAWLDDVRGQFGGGGGGAANGDAVAVAVGEARKLLSEAKGTEAVARLSELIDASGSRRQRFRAQLALAVFCTDMKKHALAASLLGELERLIDRYNLEDWEPDLAADAVKNLYECLRKAKPKPTPDDVRRSNEVFARLCRLDPSAALKLEPSGPGKT